MTKNPRVLRHNLDAESSILGGILLRNELLGQLPELDVDAFYDHRHKVVWSAIRNLESGSKPIDVVTLENEIERAGKLDAIGGIAFLSELALRVPTADNVLAYADIVRQLAMTRRLALLAGDLLERTYDSAYEPDELLEHAQEELARVALSRERGADAGAPIGVLAKRRLSELDEMARARANGEIKLSGAPTGVAALDDEIGGWQFGVVNVIAARPAMGKTALTIATAEACALLGYGVDVYSLEDSDRTYVDRCLARRSGVPAAAIRRGDLDGQRDGLVDFTRVVDAVGFYAHAMHPRWHVDDTKGLTAQEIIRRVRRRKAELGTRVVIVDYLHLVRRNPRLMHNENAALDEIMTMFAQACAPDEAWIVGCQLNRDVEKREDKRPTLPDLRGSGALEERAKIIVGLYRGSYYGDEPIEGVDYTEKRLKKLGVGIAEWKADIWKHEAQCLVMKNNGGKAPATAIARWVGPTTEMS